MLSYLAFAHYILIRMIELLLSSWTYGVLPIVNFVMAVFELLWSYNLSAFWLSGCCEFNCDPTFRVLMLYLIKLCCVTQKSGSFVHLKEIDMLLL